jgi:pimeloyl-ACP methyl ester carboxylesterase
MTKAQYRTQDLNGLRVRYRMQGIGHPLLLLHGGWMTGKMTWSKHYGALAKHFLVISPDMRGHGDTNNPGGEFTSYRRLAWDMIEFVDALKLTQKPMVMGHSSGAVISLYMSIYQPDVMERQVLSGISPFLGTSEQFRKGSLKYFGTNDQTRPPGKLNFMMRHPLLCAKLQGAHHETPWYELIKAMWPLRFSALKLDPSDYKKIISPTLVVNGEYDEYSTVEEARTLTQLIPNANFVAVPRQTHMFPVQQPELLHERALPFLLGVPDVLN